MKLAVDTQFLMQLALHGAIIKVAARIEEALILRVDVASNSYGTFGDQAFLTGSFAANVVQPTVSLPDDDVGDDLFEVRVFFGLRTRHESRLAAVEDGVDVAADV